MIPITRPDLPPIEDYHALLKEIWDSRMLSNFANFAQRLEQVAADHLGVPVKAVVSGDVGLTLSIAALRLPKGASVVVPSFTFNSTINAILWNGLRPVFADIDPRSLNLDPASANAAAARFSAELIVATHVFGNPADVDGLARVAEKYGARLIFDAAHAYGAEYDGQKVGRFGTAEVFSLSGTKLVTSAEGGLIASTELEFMERIAYLRGYGFIGDYNSRFVGMNGKMSELHAALGTLTLPSAESAVVRRHDLVAAYVARLSGLPLTYQLVRPEDTSTYKDFALLFESMRERDRVETALADADVQTKRYFLPCHQQDAYLALPREPLPVTEDVSSRSLCVPMFSSLAETDLTRIVETISEVYA